MEKLKGLSEKKVLELKEKGLVNYNTEVKTKEQRTRHGDVVQIAIK